MRKLVIECKDLETLRILMRRFGCIYDGIFGWFFEGRPIGIHYSKEGYFFTVLVEQK